MAARPIICIVRRNGQPHAVLGCSALRQLRRSLDLLTAIEQSVSESHLGERAAFARDALRELLVKEKRGSGS